LAKGKTHHSLCSLFFAFVKPARLIDKNAGAAKTGTMTQDIFIIGGGINGTGIARDAAGRGLSVTLAEMGDLAQATSSASTKLFHGGLRYLEYFEFGLVAKALEERETLLVAMPHISWPMRFVLPLAPDMRFDSTTPTSKLLSVVMPRLKGRRPNWLIRLGLFLYDTLGGRKILPATRSLDLKTDAAGAALQPRFAKAFEYSDCWVEDSRLVVLNARDAEAHGAQILTRTRVVKAERKDGLWRITTESGGVTQTHSARVLVNAAGPWVTDILHDVTQTPTAASIRLVRGSHIVTRRLYDHDRCYFFQGTDGRIIFAIPYEQDFTLIGTTDLDHQGDPLTARCSDTERDYLCNFASQYFAKPVTPADVVWTYSGVRPLYNDGASSASAATRDYVLTLDDKGAPLLSVFGGKITTYRRLAEDALAKLAPLLPMKPAWTARKPLPGGDFPHDGVADLTASLRAAHPYLTAPHAARLIRAYGTEAMQVLGEAKSLNDLGPHYGATLYEAELRWLITREYARTAADVIWRRSKLGMRLTGDQVAALEQRMSGVGVNPDLPAM
jgi:glycerol-3-phosphate dehydrogenase